VKAFPLYAALHKCRLADLPRAGKELNAARSCFLETVEQHFAAEAKAL
jgi:hypothetical protein